MEKENTLKSKGFADQTEQPGDNFPIQTHRIIRDRYDFAAFYAENKEVLEVGSGSGLGIEYLASKAKKLKCIEYNGQNFRKIKTKFASIAEIFHGDAHDMPFKDKEFDLVIALAMIYYLSFDVFVKEASRILADDGVLFFCTSNKDVPGFVGAPFTSEYYSIPEISQRLNANGFVVEFYGAFPQNFGSLSFRKFKAKLKNCLKHATFLLPKGDHLWIQLRSLYSKDMRPLPENILSMDNASGVRTLLPEDKINTEYRVIYVVAKKVLS